MARFPAFAAVFALLMTMLPARAAFVVLDNFTSPAVATITLIGPSPSPTTLINPTGFNSTRTSTFTVNSPTPPNNFDLIAQQGAGRLDFNSGTFSSARANLRYDAFTGGANNFFTAGTPLRFILTFQNLDPGLDTSTNSPALDMPVDVAISTTGGMLTGSFLLASTPSTFTYEIPFASLSGASLMSLTDVLSVDFTFNGGQNQRQRVDFVLTNIQFETVAAPAPPALFMAIAGVPAITLVRRFRRRS